MYVNTYWVIILIPTAKESVLHTKGYVNKSYVDLRTLNLQNFIEVTERLLHNLRQGYEKKIFLN